MQHPHVRSEPGGTEVGEAPPSRLLREHSGQQIEGMYRGENGKKVDAEELGRAMEATPAWSVRLRPSGIDEFVGNERRDDLEKGGGTGLREARRHGQSLPLWILPEDERSK